MPKEGRKTPEESHHADEEQAKPKFKIVDRRRIDAENVEPEEESVPEAPAPTPPASAATEEPVKVAPEIDSHSDGEIKDEAKELGDKRPETSEDPIGMRNVALSFLQTLSTIAWVHMGMVPHPQTQLVAKKLEEARKTINMFEVIYQQVKGEFPPEINAEIVGLIRDLKANYVNQL